MDLSEVQKAMVPGAEEVLRTGIGLPAGTDAFMLTAINLAMEQSGNVQSIAARKLGVTQSFISTALAGKSLTRFRPRGKYKKGDEK